MFVLNMQAQPAMSGVYANHFPRMPVNLHMNPLVVCLTVFILILNTVLDCLCSKQVDSFKRNFNFFFPIFVSS